MAFDGYRSPAPASSDQSTVFDQSNPHRMSCPPAYNAAERISARPRGSSKLGMDSNMPDAPQYSHSHSHPPIDEAVTTAFDNAHTSNYVDPKIIEQITKSVINQLKTSSLDLDGATPTPQPQQYPPPPAPPLQQPVPVSPSSHSAPSPPMPARNVYTPPSPHKHSDFASQGSPSSQPAVPHNAPPSPKEDRRAQSPMSQMSDSNRPRGPERLSSSTEETTLERIWGQLFNEDGSPTQRLSQFLRGLAMHIIEDYEPRHSLVITPNKMIKYYRDVKLPNETYPWSVVFDDEHSCISRMYRDLECSHHLVQERFDQRPDIPGLTPVGFERWVTLLIQAHPVEEYERLAKAVLAMPISNPDDKKERFPKEISRRLFPGSEDMEIRERLEKTMITHANIEIPRQSNHEHPPPPRSEPQIIPEPSYIPPSLERERKPYSNTQSESAVDDTNPPNMQPPPLQQPIERERKPYAAQPGGGKTHEDELRPSVSSRPARANSTAKTRPINIGSNGQRNHDVPMPEIHQHHRTQSHTRKRSPAGNDFRRSDGDVRGYRASSYAPTPISLVDSFEEDPRRYARDSEMKRPDWARRQADEESRLYGESPNSRSRYDPRMEGNGAPRASFSGEEDYYRGAGRVGGNGHDYSQSYGGPTYR